MKLGKIGFSLVFVMLLTVPATASSDWVEEFLHRYDPSKVRTEVATASTAGVGQLLRTGELSVSLTDVINLMIDNNLDIRSNRLGPLSSYWQTLVFYRVLQPSLSFGFNRSRNTTLSTNQVNGTVPNVSQLRTSYSVGFAQSLSTGTDRKSVV